MNHFSHLQAILSHAPLPALGLAGIAALLSSLCSVLLLSASAWLISSAALHPPLYSLALAITLVRACGLGRAVFRYLERWLSHRAVFHAQENLRLRLYRKAAALLPLRSAGTGQAEFLHQLANGCDALRDCYLRALTPPVLALMLCLMGAAFLLPVTGTGTALLLPLLWLLHLLLPLLPHSADSPPHSHASIAYRALLSDTREGCLELYAAGSAPAAAKKLQDAAHALGSCQAKEAFRKNREDALLLFLRDVSFLIFFFRLGTATLDEIISGIDLAVYLLALQTILAELSPLSEAVRMGKKSIGAAEVILCLPPVEHPSRQGATAEALSCRQSNKAPHRISSPLLSVEGLEFSYIPGLPVFSGLRFSLYPGEKIAIVGESGCGKTTLGCLLLRLWEADQGCMQLRGKDYRQLSSEDIRSAFAPCLQGEYVFHHSTRENFRRLYPDIDEEAIWDALAQAQLKEEILQLPQALDSPLGENGGLLSGGQRQRLLVALALASPAPILLLDEPTAGLDKKTAHALMDGILSHRKERALIIITHDMVLADRMDRIYRMDAS